MATHGIHYDPNTVTYDSGGSPVAVTGCKSISVNETAAVQASRSDAGTVTLFTPAGHVTGSIAFDDPVQAALIANKVAASKNLTFVVENEVGADLTVTITAIKTGGVQQTYTNGAVSGASVSFAAASVSDPA